MTRSYLILTFVLLALGGGGTAVSAPTSPRLEWAQRYQHLNAQRNMAERMAVGPDDSVYVLGMSRGPKWDEQVLIRYSRRGQILWKTLFHESTDGQDTARDMVVDASGNVYVTGTTGGNGCTTVKYAAEDGRKLWVATNRTTVLGETSGRALALGPGGSVYVTGGCTLPGSSHLDVMVQKYDSAGNRLWESSFGGSQFETDEPTGLAVDGSGAVFIVGRANTQGGFHNRHFGEGFVTRFEADGTQTWYDEIGTAQFQDSADYVAVDPAGNAIVTASLNRTGDNLDILTRKYAPDGEVLWTASRTGTEPQWGYAAGLVVHADGTVYVGLAVAGADESGDFGVLKYSPTGNLLWSAGTGDRPGSGEHPMAMTLDPEGNAYLTGYTMFGKRWDVFTARIAADGTPGWTARYGGNALNGDVGHRIGVDSQGDVLVAGYYSVGEGFDYLTLKYRSANQAPKADAGVDQTVTTTGFTANVTLDGSGSADPEGSALLYRWREGSTLLGTGTTLTVALASGNHSLTLEAEDPQGAIGRDVVRVNVVPPAGTPAARVSGSGALSVSGGQAIFTLSARAATRTGRPSGTFTLTRPDGTRLRSRALSSLVVNGDTATLYGKFTLPRRQSVYFVLTLQDLAEPGAGADTFRFELSDGTDPLTGTLATGNVVITP